ncbi:MAG: acetyl-CoA carboxylase biotin carboxyl carrier protein [Cyanobacteria bacterium P01_H01_bin.74]
MDINTSKIEELADIAREKQLSELIVQDGDKSITIKLPVATNYPNATVVQAQPGASPHQPVIYAPPAPGPIQELPSKSSAVQITENETDATQVTQITSPMVGTFYIAPSPESAPFVKVGDKVAKGQTVCIIEAMKMMNQLESEVAGKIVRVLVKNGEPVEFGQALFDVDPSA